MALLAEVALLCVASIVAVRGICPHEQEGLRLWTDASRWPGGQKPGDGADVVITDAVLLDETTPRLNTITIEPSGQLVWSPEGDYILTVSYISIKGRMDIGSEECKFNAKAHVILTGDIDTAPSIDPKGTDQKVIGVHAGGTLELHGQSKLSWTKLTQAVNKLDKNNGLLFDFKTDVQEVPWKGTVVYVFDAKTGAVVKSETFVTFTGWDTSIVPKFVTFLDEIEDGQIAIITIMRISLSSWIEKKPLYEAVERLAYGSVTGQSLFRQIAPDSLDAYVLIAVKGSPSLTEEAITPESSGSTSEGQRAYAKRVMSELGLVVSAESIVAAAYAGSSIDFRIITVDSASPIINLLDDTSTWLPGDRVVLTSTDYDGLQAEEATVLECLECTPYQTKIDLEVKYTHWGEMIEGVDERGEVALLTRNILIEGEMRDTCPTANGNCGTCEPSEKNCRVFDYDTFGGHIKTVGPGFENVHIEGVELYHVGQQTEIGHYPIHFHMSLDVDDPKLYPNPPYVKDNSIHHSFSRCLTIHGTSGVTVMDNVGYDVLGHCYFLEDGGEKRNILDGNLGANIKVGSITPLDTFENVSVFWITNPMNTVRNNVAAGSPGYGFWYIFPPEPYGPSKDKGFMRKYEARETAIWECTNNVAHSTYEGGFWFDNEMSEEGYREHSNHYSPKKEPLVEKSPSVEVNFDRITAYKNSKQNAWIRGGWLSVQKSSFADSAVGFTWAGFDEESQFMNTTIILGETANIGEPFVEWGIDYGRSLPFSYLTGTPIIGYVQYDGPVIVSDTWFNGFITNEHRPAGAYGFTRAMDHPTSAVQPTFDLMFGFDDGISTGNRIYQGEMNVDFFGKLEGDYTPTIRDLDGTLTGYEGSTVMRTTPFHLTDKCYTRASWGVSVCPYKYGKIVVLVGNVVLGEQHQPFMMRDDIPTIKEIHESQSTQAGFGVILGEQYSYTLHWGESVPSEFKVRALAAEKDFPVRVGICLPLDAKFDMRRSGAYRLKELNQWVEASSVSEIDDDETGTKYYWDKQSGLVFVKMGYKTVIDPFYERCPNMKCESVIVTLLSGTATDGDCSGRAYGPYVKQVVDNKPVLSQPDLPKTSSTPPEGYGAGETRPFATRSPVDGEFGPWGDWEECSLACGGGTQIKRRLCNNPLPQHGGQNCDLSFDARFKTRTCNEQAC